jgi:hypothetical protein
MDIPSLDIEGTLAATAAAAINRCARVSLESAQRRSRSTGKKRTAPGSRFELQAADEGEELRLSLHHHGSVSSKEKLTEALSGMPARLAHNGIQFRMDVERGESARFALRVPRPRGQSSLGGGFILGRAGDSLYAISVDEVVKCIVAPPQGQEYLLGSEKLRVMPMGGAGNPRVGVVVSAGGRKAVLLFDKLEGEEMLTSAPIDYPGARTPGMAAAAVRADGAVALVVDVAAYLSTQGAPGSPGQAGSPRRKR